jgi:hypothetical protein
LQRAGRFNCDQRPEEYIARWKGRRPRAPLPRAEAAGQWEKKPILLIIAA